MSKLVRWALWFQLNPKAWRLTAWWTATAPSVNIFCIFELGPVALFCMTEESNSPQLAFETKFILGQKEWENRG